jgi:hypothetical protein
VDLLRKTLEVAEIFSDGDFGTPKTNSSNRVLPISSTLCEVFEAQRPDGAKTGPDDLLFTTHGELHSVRRTSTTVNSRRRATGLRSHAFRGIPSGTIPRPGLLLGNFVSAVFPGK